MNSQDCKATNGPPVLRHSTALPARLSGLLMGLLGICSPLQSPAQTGDAQIVDCMFPSQVRRLGASSTTVTPRRQAKATVSECRKAGGEYIEPAAGGSTATAANSGVVSNKDDVNLWLPLAAAGVMLAQVSVGEIYERASDFAGAKTWYDKAAAQGSLRALVNLASLYEQGRGVDRDLKKAQQLIVMAAGASWLGGQSDEKPRIELVDPQATLKRPHRSSSETIPIDAPDGQVVVTGKAASTLGIDSVTVNGDAKPLDANGLFSVPVALGLDPFKLQITAVNKVGASATADYILTRSASPIAAMAPVAAVPADEAFAGKRWALVIANQDYQRWEVLDTPLADGRAISEALRGRFGFDVTLLTNATRQSTLAALSQLRSSAGPDVQVFVYYAGHGQMDPATSRGYWIPVDGDRRHAGVDDTVDRVCDHRRSGHADSSR